MAGMNSVAGRCIISSKNVLRKLPKDALHRASLIGLDARHRLRITMDAEPSFTAPRGPAPDTVLDTAPLATLRSVPRVPQHSEIISPALRRAGAVRPNPKLRNERAKAANLGARRMDGLQKELNARLNQQLSGFPAQRRLHPFEQELLHLTCGRDQYERILKGVTALKARCTQISKQYAAQCSAAKSKAAAEEAEAAGFKQVEAAFNKGAAAMDQFKSLSSQLRQLPHLNVQEPTVALVGAPNVGKSSIVNVLSSGTPEVCNYPFTTRSIKMGHFFIEGVRHQVSDTPGLLNRADAERNAMENLTLAALEHLPTAVLFVTDLTEGCGTSIADQWAIRSELQRRYPQKPWVDVFSKADLLEEEFDEADRLAADPAPTVPATAWNAARCLPGAVRVSSVTEDGMDRLKSEVMGMMSEGDMRRLLHSYEAEMEAALNAGAPAAGLRTEAR